MKQISKSAAAIGPRDLAVYESPRPDLLRRVTGLEPEPAGTHVMLKPIGVRSAQRLALADVGGGIVVALWPAELKPQAEFLYSDGRGQKMVTAGVEHGWQVWATPQLAFFTSPAQRRLYMAPEIDPVEYARRWEGADGGRVGQYEPEEVRRELWPWLKDRGYAASEDDPVLDDFLAILGRRKAHLRPALRFHRRWSPEEARTLGRDRLAAEVRENVNAVLARAGEPVLRGR